MSFKDAVESKSYFWSCLTFSEDCSFYSSRDPYLYYFGLGVTVIYIVFVVVVFSDWIFFWSLDALYHQVDQYINHVRTKIKKVQIDQRRLMSTQERTEKQLKRSKDSMKIVTALRAALNANDGSRLNALTSSVVGQRYRDSDNWSEITNAIDF